jgi:hypothetical protein
MKQTAVEWLVEQVNSDCLNSTFIRPDIIEQAKTIEKEQIINAWNKRGDTVVPRYFLQENISGEQYYNKTFKSE